MSEDAAQPVRECENCLRVYEAEQSGCPGCGLVNAADRDLIEAGLREGYSDVRRVADGWDVACSSHEGCRLHLDRQGHAVGCDAEIQTSDEVEPADAEHHDRAGSGGTGNGKAKKGAALALVELANDCDLFIDDREDEHASIPMPDGGRAIRRLASSRFKKWLVGRYFAATGLIAGREAQENAVQLLRAQATQSGLRIPLAERFSCEADDQIVRTIWVDLVDDAWRAVRVTAENWDVKVDAPILFRRHDHMAHLPEPIRGGRLDHLFEFLNLRDDSQRVLLLAWIVAAFFSRVPRPILLLHGVQGAAKTTSARVLRSLIDPSIMDALGPPRTEEQLLHQLGKHAVPIYDNLSTIHGWMADAFCRAATGGASEKRSLYTDGESVLVSYRRAVILTGINPPSLAPDLLDRTLMIELDAVPPDRRREDREIWSAFEKARPLLFGALLDALSLTLRALPDVRPASLPRMADFARIGAAMAKALGYGEDAFLAAYDRTAKRQTAEVVSNDATALALQQFMESRITDWEGTTGQLLEALRPAAPQDRRSGFPASAVWLGRKLNTLRPSLKESGIEVEPAEDLPGHGRGWRVRRVRVPGAGAP